MVTFNCSVVDLPATLRWFIDNNEFATSPFVPSNSYPLSVEPTNATYNALVGGVNVQILAASLNVDNRDMASFLSTMTVNISALSEAGVSSISCGSFETSSRVMITSNSSRG